jgi:hypothetical protein
MNLAKTLEDVMAKGVRSVVIGIPEQGGVAYFAACEQGMPTGDTAQIILKHQVGGISVEEVILGLTNQVHKATSLAKVPTDMLPPETKNNVLKMPGGRG